jgi:hypothetical protein
MTQNMQKYFYKFVTTTNFKDIFEDYTLNII